MMLLSLNAIKAEQSWSWYYAYMETKLFQVQVISML